MTEPSIIAPTIDRLYMVEAEVHKAIKTVLEANSIPCYVPRDKEPVKYPYVSARIQLGSATGHQHIRPFNKRRYFDAWDATIEFQIYTDREVDESPSSPIHDEWKAAIRRIMQTDVCEFGRDVLPYHGLVKIIEQGTVPEIDNDQDLDISEITFSATACIRTDVWP